MARYIDADELYKATQKRIAEANEARMAVVDDEFLDLINDAFTEDVAPRAEWISVEERLPDENGRFLTVDKIGDMMVCYWEKHFGWFAIVCNKNAITHWMPLPEPPKGD
jgi:hypothetical protein